MLNRLRPRAACLSAILLLSLLLTACGSTAQSTPGQSGETGAASTTESEPIQTEQATTPATTEPIAATQEAAEVAATSEAEATPAESPAVSTAPQAVCQAVDIPNNELIAPASAEEWSKGPAEASVTLIEYGDFQ